MSLAADFKALDALLTSGSEFTPNQVPRSTEHALMFFIQAKEHETAGRMSEARIILERLVRDWPEFAAPKTSLAAHHRPRGENAEAKAEENHPPTRDFPV